MSDSMKSKLAKAALVATAKYLKDNPEVAKDLARHVQKAVGEMAKEKAKEMKKTAESKKSDAKTAVEHATQDVKKAIGKEEKQNEKNMVLVGLAAAALLAAGYKVAKHFQDATEDDADLKADIDTKA